ncbi:hypothetical protein BK284_23215 [Escherichia coli]|nr:hypothetical protein BK284_23215 [Escherichia coli]
MPCFTAVRAEIALMSGSAFAVTHHAFSSGAGRTSDGNGSHASTLKSPSYTKSVSWQHYLQSEELKRVTFEGIPPKDDKSSRVTVSIRQDLPVLIHPTSLPEEREAWKFLEWRKNGDQIEISNPSNYVVRMTLQFKTLPSGKTGAINKTYFLPHTSTTTALTNATDTKVEFYPASRYGYRGNKYVTDLK